jgi:segregation and condensation protein A
VVTEAVLELEAGEGNGLELSLPSFTGPLDLLLHLIHKNQVSIYDTPVALICDQYQQHLRAMQELDLEVAAEFLWMASWLLELKSKVLLPRYQEGSEDPRRELVERLVEYRRCKQLADLLHEQDLVRRCLWQPALPVPGGTLDAELDWEEVDLHYLATAYLEVMQRFAAANPPPLTVEPLRFKVEEAMSELYGRVSAEGLLPLLRLLHSSNDIDEVVVLVVATLELVRLGGICAEQRLPFSEVYLRLGPVRLDRQHLLRVESSGVA